MIDTSCMTTHRLSKQIVIVAIALLLLFAAVTGLFVLVVNTSGSAPLSPSPSPEFAPITVEKVHVIRHSAVSGLQQTAIDLVAQIRNPNPTAGIGVYPLTFVVHSRDGAVIATNQQLSYLLPGSLRYVAALNVSIGANTLGNVEVQLPSNPTFTAVPASIKAPEFNVFLKELSRRTLGSTPIEEQRAVIRNVGTLDWEKVEITAVALSADNEVIGVGKTFVGALNNTQEREFTVQWPVPTAATSRVIALPSTNIFAEDNLMRVIGDPNALR